MPLFFQPQKSERAIKMDTKTAYSSALITQLAFLQFFLIWPLVPVSGLSLPIFTIALAKSVMRFPTLLL